MSIKKWFTGKATVPQNNMNKQDKVKQLSIFPTRHNSLSSTTKIEQESSPASIPKEQASLQVSYLDGNDSQSCEQIVKEKSVRKFGLFGLWWRNNRNSNHVQFTEGTTERQSEGQVENNQLLKDPSVLAFLESVDRRLNDNRLPLDKSDMVRLETFQAQAIADGCNELLDIIEYFEWENDRCLLMLRSAGPSKPLSAVACSS
ncbi:hypothetical protein GpartN1_g5557.t1 [Galdieria partita]|uniref:Uncharacterized protein n=1 Tax=Galdieria partita TaxID=83374 RepID=A0A9C7US79_9RHOD|nr:hypothetical protein GpartN1_g5557.t1 [Galdieria partita]